MRSLVDGTGSSSWEPDNSSDGCRVCKKNFSLVRRRHHCRSCGRLICSKCSVQERMPAEWAGLAETVKICSSCAKVWRDSVELIKYRTGTGFGGAGVPGVPTGRTSSFDRVLKRSQSDVDRSGNMRSGSVILLERYRARMRP